jgi:hypothetical protein
MASRKPRRPMSKVKQRLKHLIEEYRAAQREQHEAAARLAAANLQMCAVKIQLSAHVKKHKIDSYRALFVVEKDTNGRLTSRKIVGGKNLKIDGVVWPADAEDLPTGPDAPETPDCESFCNDAMVAAADSPDWGAGEVWCICNCPMSAGGGMFPGGGVECFGEDEVPAGSDDE